MSPVINRYSAFIQRSIPGVMRRSRYGHVYHSRKKLSAAPLHVSNGLTALFSCIMLASTGCRQKEPEFQVVSLEGTVENVTAETENTGEITLRYYREKQGKEVLGTGLVTKETEIMIDGALADLTDVREGDKVRGEVRIETRQGRTINVALKISVERSTLPAPDDG